VDRLARADHRRTEERQQPAAVAVAVPTTCARIGHDTSNLQRAGERFLDLTVSRPYTPSPPTGGTDDYRCMVIDPRLTTPTFLTGSQFRPQNEPIVHHAIIFAIPAGDAATARAKDAETEAEGWTCFGDTNLDGRQEPAWVDTWTPGAPRPSCSTTSDSAWSPGACWSFRCTTTCSPPAAPPGLISRPPGCFSGVHLHGGPPRCAASCPS
jgi:hypothetical protein